MPLAFTQEDFLVYCGFEDEGLLIDLIFASCQN